MMDLLMADKKAVWTVAMWAVESENVKVAMWAVLWVAPTVAARVV